VLSSYSSNGQDSSKFKIFDRVLSSENVWEKVSINQGGTLNAYLMVDSIFIHTCPSILDSLQKYRGRVPLGNTQRRNVHIVNDPWFNIERAPLFVLFKRMRVSGKKMQVVFRTSSLYEREEFKDRYSEITCYLNLRHNEWILQTCKITPLTCCDNVFDEIEID
jgi:hypothetical protein